MRDNARYELKRLFFTKESLSFLTCILILSFILTNFGIKEYKGLKNKKELFGDYEKSRVSRYITYDQYGGFGFRVMYEPSPLIVFFFNSYLFYDLESNIDTTEILRIYTLKKGQSLFKKGKFIDFSGILFFCGSIYMMFSGLSVYKNSFYAKFISNKKYAMALSLITRLLIADLFFIVIIFLNFYFAVISGISFSSNEIDIFKLFAIYILFFLNLFYFIGFIISSLFQSHRNFITIIVWIFFIFVVPEISNMNLVDKINDIPTNESLNIEKISVLMNVERNARNELLNLKKEKKYTKEKQYELVVKFLNDGYIENKEKECRFNAKVSDVIKSHENQSSYIPVNFYKLMSSEISSKGYYGYQEFVEFNVNTKDEFFNFYVKKRYKSNDQSIESFVKKDENIFKAESQLPENYTTALLLTLAYTILLFLISFFILHFRLKKQPEISPDKIPDMEFKKGRSYFIYRKKSKDKNNLFQYYAAKKNTVVLDKISPQDIDTGIKPVDMFTFYCKILGTDINYAIESLKILGIENIYLLKRKDLKENQEEEKKGILKKIYMAASLNQNCETIVVNDFVKGESRTFEKQFINLLLKMESQNKTILYLGTEPYVSIDWKTQFQDEMPEKEIPINLKEVSFR